MQTEVVFYGVMLGLSLLHSLGLVLHFYKTVRYVREKDLGHLERNRLHWVLHTRQLFGALLEGLLFGAFLGLSYLFVPLMDQLLGPPERAQERARQLPFYQKKLPPADLHSYHGLFISTGFLVALLVVIGIMLFPSYEPSRSAKPPEVYEVRTGNSLVIPETHQPAPKPPGPPPPQPVVQPVVKEVPDEEEVSEQRKVKFEEMEEEQAINEFDPNIVGVEGGTGGGDGTGDGLAYGAPEPPPEEVKEIYEVVEVMPKPRGGMSNFFAYLAQEIQYPDKALALEIEGRVFVRFVVDTDGRLTNLRVVKGIGGGCDQEALRVLRKAEPWEPGRQRGKPVKVKYTVPIHFQIDY